MISTTAKAMSAVSMEKRADRSACHAHCAWFQEPGSADCGALGERCGLDYT